MKKGFSQSNLPIWLRRLGRVKQELAGVHWPTHEETFQQGIALMAFGLNSFKGRKSLQKYLIQFSKTDSLWTKRWRKERARLLSFSD